MAKIMVYVIFQDSCKVKLTPIIMQLVIKREMTGNGNAGVMLSEHLDAPDTWTVVRETTML